jgi:hypothetical protein
MTKLERIEMQEQKARAKIASMQAILKQINGQRTEQENLQIIQQIRALKLSREELYTFLNNGELPALFVGALGENATEPKKIYSRREKNRKKKSETADESQTETPESESPENEFPNNSYESEEKNHVN